MRINVYLFMCFFVFLIAAYDEIALCAPIASEEQVIRAVEKVKPSVVNISTTGSGPSSEGGGSGVIISGDGFILTNTHVIYGARTIKVSLSDGRKFSAFVVRASSNRDLAVIRINSSGLPVPSFGNSDRLRLGQAAIAIGNPLKFSWTVTVGCVSAMNRDLPAKGILYRDLIQTDAAINPGSSGGALVNSRGEVIGINTLVLAGTPQYSHVVGLNFAIPINSALSTAKVLMADQSKASPKPWIGISGKTLTAEIADTCDLPAKKGVLVENVTVNGPAAAAGILPGDMITEVDGQVLHNVEELKAKLGGLSPGSVIEFTVWHGGKKKKVKVTVDHLSQ
jgi:S1-C subfamily serine protease